MRAIKELMDDVLFHTGNDDNSRYSDKRLLKFFNAAQRKVQKYIFLSNPENNFFSKEYALTLVNGQEQYDLSALIADLWSKNSISAVLRVRDSGSGVKSLKKLTYKERSSGYGYYIFNKCIGFTPIPTQIGTSTVLIAYQAKIPDLVNRNSVSELPAVCEDILMRLVERMIQYSNSSEEFGNAFSLTEEEKMELKELFAELNDDPSHPPITSDAYVNY